LKVKRHLQLIGILGAVFFVQTFFPPLPALAAMNFGHKPYRLYLEEHPGARAAQDVIEIDLQNFTVGGEMEVGVGENTITTGERGAITWTFDVREEGFYHLAVEYRAVEGKGSTIQREIRLDGEIPFEGAHQVLFYRTWVDQGPVTEKRNNEIRPNQIERPEWQRVFVSDSQKYVPDPFQFYLSAGTHTLTFVSIREPLEIGGLTLQEAPLVPTYASYLQAKQEKYKIYAGPNIKFQAERLDGDDHHTLAIKKSSPTLHAMSNFSSTRLEPYHPYYIRLNTIGGYNWRVMGDWIRWEIEVPQEGLYQLSLSVLQNTKRGVFAARELKINGEVPFQEAYALEFPYNTRFEMYTVGNEAGPYLIHLKQGVNTIELQSTLGAMGPIIQEVKESVTILNDLYRQITQITGVAPEKYIDYQLERKLPHLVVTMEQEHSRLTRIVAEIEAISGDRSDETALLDQMAVQLGELVKSPNKVIRQITMMESNISAMSTWILQASEQPLEIDYFLLASPQNALPEVQAGFLERLYYSVLRFASTFFVDYNDFKADAAGHLETIEVWMQSGRDQVQILRNLIDNTFTPVTDIQVNLKLVPIGVVLPATLAGEGPDVVLGLGGDTTINFAMRDAAYDLTQFEDFEEVARRFAPSAFDIMRYHGGIYGLPETQSFLMLFYRQDVLDELQLAVPQTWTDVYRIIPYLEMNNYQFYVPNTLYMYTALLYQMGGSLYRGEGADLGIESGLDSPEAMEAFKIWTDFFTSYKLPVEADFPNRFRTGEMPIGIADYTMYNTLAVFAPEIQGLWGFSALPGMESPAGIQNQSVSMIGNSMLLKGAKNKEASWEFLKWWTSTDTQVNYGRGLEGIMGAAARYQTANLEAVARLPWDSASYDQLRGQFENVCAIPEVPGGYITWRQVDYALRAVINDGKNPRETLHENVKAINDELTIKRTEFGLSTRDRGGN
jgi:ABC-type glycerol-3-phosphate transport system substrate-binding protein